MKMMKYLAILCTVAMFAVATPLFAEGENPCGNHGNNCCTDDGGATYVSVETECGAFCDSVAVAVSVATSEAAAECSVQVVAAVESASAACAQICNVPSCTDWKLKYNSAGQIVRRKCLNLAH